MVSRTSLQDAVIGLLHTTYRNNHEARNTAYHQMESAWKDWINSRDYANVIASDFNDNRDQMFKAYSDYHKTLNDVILDIASLRDQIKRQRQDSPDDADVSELEAEIQALEKSETASYNKVFVIRKLQIAVSRQLAIAKNKTDSLHEEFKQTKTAYNQAQREFEISKLAYINELAGEQPDRYVERKLMQNASIFTRVLTKNVSVPVTTVLDDSDYKVQIMAVYSRMLDVVITIIDTYDKNNQDAHQQIITDSQGNDLYST